MLSRNSRFRRPALAAALLAATTLAGAGVWQVSPAFAQDSATQPHIPAIDTSRPAAQALPGFADLVQRVSPAVVTITTTMQQTASDDDDQSPFPSGSPQDRMFGQFFGMHPQMQQPARMVHALGSGFIIDSQGHIVTNDHVVKDGSNIQVTLADGTKLPAKVVGVDPKTDLALLQVNAGKPLPHLALGDSSATRVGDWVVAVGNPFGLGGTVTAGILSARGRQIGEGPYDDFLQVDAPINRGNSGGPLFAQDGSVIGVNTAIYSPSGGSVGIGFAIPSNVVKTVVSQLESNGRVSRGYLGVAAQQISPTMAKALSLSSDAGALVAQVEDDSPAKAAGLQPGQVITKVGDQDVHNPRDLARIIAGVKAGTDEPIQVLDNGQSKTVNVTIAALKDGNGSAQASNQDSHGAKLGLALAPLNDDARQELNLPGDQKGVVIAQVQPDSPADQAGLKAGDVLEMVGPKRVTTPEQAVSALRDGTKGSGAVALRVLRDGQHAFFALSASANSEG